MKREQNTQLINTIIQEYLDTPEEQRSLTKLGEAYGVRRQTISKWLKDRGIEVIIAAAGGAAHLAGVIASSTPLPVIGIPVQTSALGGMDSLLSTVQMPSGVPVATVAIGKAGPKNAAILACQMIGLKDKEIQDKIIAFKKEQAEKVLKDSYVE